MLLRNKLKLLLLLRLLLLLLLLLRLLLLLLRWQQQRRRLLQLLQLLQLQGHCLLPPLPVLPLHAEHLLGRQVEHRHVLLLRNGPFPAENRLFEGDELPEETDIRFDYWPRIDDHCHRLRISQS